MMSEPILVARGVTKVLQAVRQQVRPGITGLAQITLHYDTCIDDVRKKVAADLEYIQKQSLLEDLRIMALTAPAVLLKKGGW